MRRWESVKLPEAIDYDMINGLSIEACQKFKNIRPVTVGQASRIEGIRPADVWLLIVYLEKH